MIWSNIWGLVRGFGWFYLCGKGEREGEQRSEDKSEVEGLLLDGCRHSYRGISKGLDSAQRRDGEEPNGPEAEGARVHLGRGVFRV